MRFLLLSSILPLLLSAEADAQSVHAYVPVDTVAVGTRFQLWVVAEHRAGTRALFPDTTTFGDLVVVGRGRVFGRAVASGIRRDSVAYEVTTFVLDTARVPPLRVAFSGEGDTVRTATRPFLVPVRSVVPSDAQGLKALAPPAPFPPDGWPYLLLGGAVGLLLALLGYLVWRRRRNAPDATAPASPPTTSPYEEARARLEALELPPNSSDADMIKGFYTTLSDTLRRYLARRLGVAAHECTTRELLVVLRDEVRLPASANERVHTALEHADLVKFADARPGPPAHQEALEATYAALDAVEETQRTAPPSPSTDAPSLNLETQTHAEDQETEFSPDSSGGSRR